MLRIWLTVLLFVCITGVGIAAPPEPSEAVDSIPEEPVEVAVPDEAEVPYDELDELYDEQDYRGKKFIEIRIDDEGIRGIDEFGNEVIFEERLGRGDRDDEYSEAERRYKDARDLAGGGEQAIVEFGNVYIEYDDEIDGDVVTIKGNVTVDGIVYGNIISPKTVVLGPEAIVTGDIIAKRLEKDPDAEFHGRHIPFSFGSFPFPYEIGIGLPGLGSWIIVTIFMLIFTSLFMMIFQRPVKRIQYHIATGFFKNLGIGLVLILAILPVFVLLCITIVGIPVAVIVYPLGLLGAFILGHIGAAYYMGRALGRLTGSLRFDSTFVTTIVGVTALMASWMISGFFVAVGSEAFAIFFFVFGIITLAIAATAGLGAVWFSWFSRFGTRPADVDPSVPDMPSQAEIPAPVN
jgi:hypothetical protein